MVPIVRRPLWSGKREHTWVILTTAAVLSVNLGGCVVPAESDTNGVETSEETPTEIEEILPPGMVPERVSESVLAVASEDLQVPQSELSILRFNREVWNDSCLGLGQPNELCLQALVPGWQLEIVHTNQSYFYRTDDYGDVVRRSTLENNLPPSIAELVINRAAAQASIPANQLTITTAGPRVWDGCLGVAAPDTVCTQIAIFGWRAVVEGNGERLVYHTDMSGNDIRFNDII